jgi:CrcB protein
MKLKARSVVAVFVGGLVGSAARLGLTAASAALEFGDNSAVTLVVNILGSFALGVLVSAPRAAMPEWLFMGISVGFLASFTTLSAVSADVVTSVASGGLAIGVAYASANLVFGVFAAIVGLRAGTALSGGRS